MERVEKDDPYNIIYKNRGIMLYFKPPPPKQSLSSKNRERRQINLKNRGISNQGYGSEFDSVSLSPITVLQSLRGSKVENKMWHTLQENNVPHSITIQKKNAVGSKETLKTQVMTESLSNRSNRSSALTAAKDETTHSDNKNIANPIKSTIEIKMWRSLDQNIAPISLSPNQNMFCAKDDSIVRKQFQPIEIMTTSTEKSAGPHSSSKINQHFNLVNPTFEKKEVTSSHEDTHPSSYGFPTAATTATTTIPTPSRETAIVSRRRLLGREEIQDISSSKPNPSGSSRAKKYRQAVVVHIEQPKRTSIDTPPVWSSQGERVRTHTASRSRKNSSLHNEQEKPLTERVREITANFAVKYVADLFALASALLDRDRRVKHANKIFRFLRSCRQRRLCVAISLEGRRLLWTHRQHIQSLVDMDWEDRQRLRTAQRRLLEQQDLARLLEEKQIQKRDIQPAILKLLMQPINEGDALINGAGRPIRQGDGTNDGWEKDALLNEAEMNGEVPVIMTAARKALLSLAKMDAKELTKLREKSKHLLQFTRPFPPIRQRMHEYD